MFSKLQLQLLIFSGTQLNLSSQPIGTTHPSDLALSLRCCGGHPILHLAEVLHTSWQFSSTISLHYLGGEHTQQRQIQAMLCTEGLSC